MSTLDTIEEKTMGILNLKPTTHQKLANHWNIELRIIPPNRYLDIEKMNTSSFSDGDDYYASYYDNIDDADYRYIDGGN